MLTLVLLRPSRSRLLLGYPSRFRYRCLSALLRRRRRRWRMVKLQQNWESNWLCNL
ncbi:hypothetical protein LINPERPRIM_LOCUS17830 [Linum perenne]